MASDATSEAVVSKNARNIGLEDAKYTWDDETSSVIEDFTRRLSERTTSVEDGGFTNSILERGRAFDRDKNHLSRSSTWDWDPAKSKNMSSLVRTSSDYLSGRRRVSLQLPSFRSLGISTNHSISFVQENGPAVVELTSADASLASSKHISPVFCNTLSPLTPPAEETPAFSMDFFDDETTPIDREIHSRSQTDQPSHGTIARQEAHNVRVQPMRMLSSIVAADPSQYQKLPLIAEASHKMVSLLESGSSLDAIHVVSQTLPCQAKDGRSKPTFEAILESLQTDMNHSPYITITHAVPQARVMDDLPKTPPSTPNFRNEISDYFGNDQTIFTHAAVVPIYHSHDRANYALAGKLVHHIAAPLSTQVSILERYIPPTMPEEIQDFFGLSTRSYLSDRLSELSANNGSLLLIYPTLNGGNAFARHYIGPLIDPYLRRFIMLKGLTSVAANLMGEMTAVSHMLSFEDMRNQVASLCQNLNSQSTARKSRSAFSVTYSDVSNIVLDRSTWLNWYVEQEQSRLRQNLVEYHQEGGRMPEADGHQEVTVGMLTRDFIKGLQKSQEPAGVAEIEVGVFLITRTRIQ